MIKNNIKIDVTNYLKKDSFMLNEFLTDILYLYKYDRINDNDIIKLNNIMNDITGFNYKITLLNKDSLLCMNKNNYEYVKIELE